MIIIRENPLFSNSTLTFDLLKKESHLEIVSNHDGRGNSWGNQGRDGKKNKSFNESCRGVRS